MVSLYPGIWYRGATVLWKRGITRPVFSQTPNHLNNSSRVRSIRPINIGGWKLVPLPCWLNTWCRRQLYCGMCSLNGVKCALISNMWSCDEAGVAYATRRRVRRKLRHSTSKPRRAGSCTQGTKHVYVVYPLISSLVLLIVALSCLSSDNLRAA